jgi:hypothetical protein
MSRIAVAAHLACAAYLATTGLGTTAALAGPCKARVASTGNPKSVQYLASVSSKYTWKDKVKDRYGSDYSTWSNAKDKNVDCSKSGPNRLWQCTAVGRPCK